jgi:hypothetical protein
MGTSWAKCRIVLPMNQKWFHDFCAPPQQGHGKNVKEIYDASMKVVLFPCCTLVVKYDRCQGLSQQPVVKVEVRPSFWIRTSKTVFHLNGFLFGIPAATRFCISVAKRMASHANENL